MTTDDLRQDSSAGPHTAKPGREWILAVVCAAAISLLIVSPFFWLGVASGHDFEFHAASWIDAANQWKQHIAYPRWHEWANYGFGEPRFIFYPPLSWMLGAALSFVAKWNAVPATFIALTQAIACLCAFAFARRWLPFRGALLAAAFYTANPYALLVIYMRSDFAEQLASAFLPLLFLAAFQLISIVAHRTRATWRPAAFFAFAFAAIWLANAPAGVLASYALALLFIWSAFADRDWRILANGAGALALGLGLAAFYLVPAAYEQKWVNIGQILSTGLLPSENFLYTAGRDPEHTFFNWIASTIAVALILLALAASLTAKRWAESAREPQNHTSQKEFAALLVISAAAILMMFRVSSLAWMLFPKLRFVQFPWRAMLILAVPCALFLGAASLRRLGTLLVLTALAISTATAVFLVRHTWWDADDIPTLRAALAQGKGFEGTDEYDPAGDDHYDLPPSAPHVKILPVEDSGKPANAMVILQRWTPEDRRMRVHSREPVRLALRLLNYPAWRVEVNGRETEPEHPDGTQQMIVWIPPGDSQVTIEFERTMDRSIGGAISWMALIVALGLLVWPAQHKDPDSPELPASEV